MKYTFSILQVYCYFFSQYTFSTFLCVYLQVYAIIIKVLTSGALVRCANAGITERHLGLFY